jgi:ABC-type enterochelin transport system ATPase subunit
LRGKNQSATSTLLVIVGRLQGKRGFTTIHRSAVIDQLSHGSDLATKFSLLTFKQEIVP